MSSAAGLTPRRYTHSMNSHTVDPLLSANLLGVNFSHRRDMIRGSSNSWRGVDSFATTAGASAGCNGSSPLMEGLRFSRRHVRCSSQDLGRLRIDFDALRRIVIADYLASRKRTGRFSTADAGDRRRRPAR
jgi:hypothetical protein